MKIVTLVTALLLLCGFAQGQTNQFCASNQPCTVSGNWQFIGPNAPVTSNSNVAFSNVTAPIQPVNRYALRGVLTKIGLILNGNASQLVYVNAGDSMKEMSAGMVGIRLGLMLGFAGAALDFNYTGDTGLHQLGGILPTIVSGAVTHPCLSSSAPPLPVCTTGPDYTRWPTGGYYGVSTGGVMTFALTGTGALGIPNTNKLSLYYIAEPGAGTINIDSSPDGTTWTNEVTGLNAANASTIGAVWTITKGSNANYQIRVTGATGTVNVIGAGMRATNTAGVVSVGFGVGSLEYNLAMSTPTAITAPIFADIAPDLVSFEVRETTSLVGGVPTYPDATTLTARLTDFRSRWVTANPRASFLWLSSPPRHDTDAINTATEIPNNQAMAALAATNSDVYFDNYSMGVDGPTISAMGWLLGDNVHPSATGRMAMSAPLWASLNFDGGTGWASFLNPPKLGTITSTLNFNNSADAAFIATVCQAGLTTDQFCRHQFRNHSGTAIYEIRTDFVSYGAGGALVLRNLTTGTDSLVLLPDGSVRVVLATGKTLGIRNSGGTQQATIGDTGVGTFNGGVAPSSTGTVTWTSGAGVPAAGNCTTAKGGSLFSRTDGTTTTTLYVCDGSTGVWTAK